MVVLLDQEKAYNHILHRFLFTLEKFGFPQTFIDTIKALYSDAHTKVILNTEISKSFQVIRSVRQGNPLFCLLFDIAIKSLAQMLCESGLASLSLGNVIQCLIVTMFVDNTMVYLAESNNFQILEDVLKKWCKVSDANFNILKTVIVWVRFSEFKKSVVKTRKTMPLYLCIPSKIKIAKDGKATHLLRAFM